MKLRPTICLLVASVAVGSVLPAKTIVIDGDPSDWTGTPPAAIHDIAISSEEWIYKGEANDLRTDPGGGLSNRRDARRYRRRRRAGGGQRPHHEEPQ